VSLNAQRQQLDLAWLASGAEFSLGDAAQAPLPPGQLAALAPASPGVEAVVEAGLTARVFKLRAQGRCWAVKVERPASLVHNVDGRTAFLNELRRHADVRALRAAGVAVPGVVAPVYGSLRHGVLASPWIEGESVAGFDERRLRQLFETGVALHAQGLFEWDFSPGNLIDDGRQVWLFDFGYMYRFDPLTQFNSAGRGDDCPDFHLAERIETRNAFAWLLDVEQQQGLAAALGHYRLVKRFAIDAYAGLQANLARRGAATRVLCWLEQIRSGWADALAGDLHRLYLREGWRSHGFDLDDDLHGASCTPRTLQRADWLIRTAQDAYAALQGAGALSGADAALSPAALVGRYRERRRRAEGLQAPCPS
jgi:tRNA A-37 threonylcarbamoyl transferase component Bud32